MSLYISVSYRSYLGYCSSGDIEWSLVNPDSVNPENLLSGHILQGTDLFFINLTRLYGNLRSGTENPKHGTKCTLSIESQFVNPEMLIIKWEMCQSILHVNVIS